MSSTSSSDVDEDFLEIQLLLDNVEAGRTQPQQAAGTLAKMILAKPDIEDNWLGVIGSIVQAVEISADGHEAFAELLACIAQLPTPYGEDGERIEIIYRGNLWDSLPGLGWELRDEWNGPDDEWTREKKIQHWRNMNNFVAHMTKTKVEALFYDLYCIWTLREALESPFTERKLRDLPFQIPGAAAWIDVLGSEICLWDETWDDNNGPNQGGGNRAGGDELWDGVPGFCPERWALWKRQFGVVSTHPGVDAATREVAARAEAKMIEIDANLAGASGDQSTS